MSTKPSTGQLPLSDTTVIDITQVIAGPFATMQLGDLGADVLKIEAVGRGDRARSFTPRPEYFDTVNRNKRSIAVDLKADEGREIVGTLIEEADVIIESMKPGRAEDFGLTYEDAHARNPEIIYCSISGFGRDSPYKDVPAWDMVIQAMSGIMSVTGTPDTPPLWSGLPSGDLAAATYAVQSVLAALYARECGRIQTEWIEVPMLDAAVSWLTARAGYTFGNDEPFPKLGVQHPSAAPFGIFEAADDALVIAASTETLWHKLCVALDREDLVSDDRFASRDDRATNSDALRAELEGTLATQPVDVWVELLHEAGVPAGPIHDTMSVWSDEHVEQRGLRTTINRADRPDATVIDHPVHFTDLDVTLRTAPQDLGDSTDEILHAHGYSDAELNKLRENEVIE